MADSLKLLAADEPRIELELPNGEKKSFDPWEVAEKLETGMRTAATENDATLLRTFDEIRKAVGFPTQAEVDAAADPKPYTLSRNACMKVQRSINDFVVKFDTAKK